jgi:ribosomal protein L17
MLSNLANSLFENGSVTTTEARVKRVQPLAEKLITKARRGDLHARRTVLARLRNKAVVAKLFEEIAPAIDEAREGGYTRIVKLGNRRGDNAPLAEISLVLEAVEKKKKTAAKPAAKAEAKAEEKAEEKAAQEVEEQAAQPTAEAPEASEAPAQTEKEAE